MVVVARALPERALLLGSIAMVLAAAAVGLQPLLQVLHAGWTERYGHFEHGYLVLALALWMAARHWRAAPPQVLRPDWLALAPLVGLVAVLGGLELMFVNSARLSLLPPLFIAVVALVLGRRAASSLLWPALFVYFALPQWWAINGMLQSLTVAVVTRLVSLTGIPAYIEGSVVHVPAGVFEIASGCSGLNYLVVGLALGAFHALMYLRSWRRHCGLVLAAGLLALVSNWIRVYLLILVGHLSEMQHYLITVEHHTAGWVLFLVLMSPMLLVARRMEDRERGQAAPEAPPGRGFRALAWPGVSPSVFPAAGVAALVLLAPLSFAPDRLEGIQPPAPLPARLAGLDADHAVASAWQPVFVNAASDRATYRRPGVEIEVYRAVYAHQDYDHRLVRGHNDILGRGFQDVVRELREVTIAGDTFTVLEHRGMLDGRERLVWSWYWVGGVPAATQWDARLAEARSRWRGRGDGVALALSTECKPDCGQAGETLAQVVSAAASELKQVNPAASQDGQTP